MPMPSGRSPGAKPLPSSRTVSTSDPSIRPSDHLDVAGARVPRHVRERFLRDPRNRLARTRIEHPIVGQGARLESDRRAGAEPDRLALLAQERHQPGIADWRALKLIEHGFHLGHRLARGGADLLHRGARAGRVGVEARLRRRAGGLDHEQLLLHRIVQIAREPRPLFLPSPRCGSRSRSSSAGGKGCACCGSTKSRTRRAGVVGLRAPAATGDARFPGR